MHTSSQSRITARQFDFAMLPSTIADEACELARRVRRRWRLYRMQWLDDYMLDDIGVTREELEWAIRLPLRINAALALHDRARRRRVAKADGKCQIS